MPPYCTQYENLAILKTHSRRILMHLTSRYHRKLLLKEISSMYYSKDQVKVRPAVIHYKGVNGVLETQEPRGAVR